MNRTQDEKCLWTWIWTKDGADIETVPEEPGPEPETEKPEPEPSPKANRGSRQAGIVPEKFAAQDFGRNNLSSKQSGNLW